ncbi:hypothetical protein Golob_024845, partial [Gossypium lobatum]|nr:hypothetical protein [Gossypium lobatum]
MYDLYLERFSTFTMKHLPHSFFNYCPLLIDTMQRMKRQHVERFHFESCWLLEDSFEAKTNRLWKNNIKSVPHTNVKEQNSGDIVGCLGVRSSTNSKRYLGLQNMVSRNKRWAFQVLKDLLRSR